MPELKSEALASYGALILFGKSIAQFCHATGTGSLTNGTPHIGLIYCNNYILIIYDHVCADFADIPNKRLKSFPEAQTPWLEDGVKLSIAIQKGKETREAVITLTKESNAEYVFKRLPDLGWLVLSADRLP